MCDTPKCLQRYYASKISEMIEGAIKVYPDGMYRLYMIYKILHEMKDVFPQSIVSGGLEFPSSDDL